MIHRRRGRMIVLLAGIALSVVVLFCALYWTELVVWYQLRGSFTLARLRNEQGLTEFRHRATGIVMVLLPGGTFLMGSPEDEKGSDPDEHPQHEVHVTEFLIAKYGAPGQAWERGKPCRAHS